MEIILRCVFLKLSQQNTSVSNINLMATSYERILYGKTKTKKSSNSLLHVAVHLIHLF